MNHASIAFDDRLTEVFSFGRRNPDNPFIGGFVEEDLGGKLFGNASCQLYRCTVSKQAYDRMVRHVEEMRGRKHQFKYNLWGLLCVMMNVRLERRNAYFCSQFVASVFEKNGCAILGKPAALVTPGDLAASPSLRLVYQGHIRQLTQPLPVTG
jgi:hypothetical protein